MYVFHRIVSCRKITAITGAIAGFRKNASDPVAASGAFDSHKVAESIPVLLHNNA